MFVLTNKDATFQVFFLLGSLAPKSYFDVNHAIVINKRSLKSQSWIDFEI